MIEKYPIYNIKKLTKIIRFIICFYPTIAMSGYLPELLESIFKRKFSPHFSFLKTKCLSKFILYVDCNNSWFFGVVFCIFKLFLFCFDQLCSALVPDGPGPTAQTYRAPSALSSLWLRLTQPHKAS